MTPILKLDPLQAHRAAKEEAVRRAVEINDRGDFDGLYSARAVQHPDSRRERPIWMVLTISNTGEIADREIISSWVTIKEE